MIITATQSNATITPRKMRLVAYAVKTMTPTEALEQLTFLNKEAARILAKVLKQALANAKHNSQVDSNDLTIKEIVVNKGRILKRGRAAARGRSKPFKHQQSHVTIKLETIPAKAIPAPVAPTKAKATKTTPVKAATKKAAATVKAKITKKITKATKTK